MRSNALLSRSRPLSTGCHPVRPRDNATPERYRPAPARKHALVSGSNALNEAATRRL